jgi:acetoacetate decarboxylase
MTAHIDRSATVPPVAIRATEVVMICTSARSLTIAAAVLALAATAQVSIAQDFEGTSLSSRALPYAAPPYVFAGSQYLVTTIVTTPAVLRAMVPEPLEPKPQGLVHVMVVRQHLVEPEEILYSEAILAVPVSYEGVDAIYMPVLYLDQALPIVTGREIYGYNKVDAEIEWSESEGTVHATVRRWGETLIDVRAQLGEPLAQIPQRPSSPNLNLKHIPSVEAGAPPDVLQLTSTTLTDVKVTTMRPGAGELALGSATYDPLGSIPVLALAATVYYEQDFVLGGGEVVHDYLAPAVPTTDEVPTD